VSGSRRIAFVVTGHVQGVAFRAHARDTAREIGVTGFVMNRADGAVLGEAQGSSAQVAAFVAFLHRGSPWSRVDGVTIDESTPIDGEPSFVVRR